MEIISEMCDFFNCYIHWWVPLAEAADSQQWRDVASSLPRKVLGLLMYVHWGRAGKSHPRARFIAASTGLPVPEVFHAQEPSPVPQRGCCSSAMGPQVFFLSTASISSITDKHLPGSKAHTGGWCSASLKNTGWGSLPWFSKETASSFPHTLGWDCRASDELSLLSAKAERQENYADLFSPVKDCYRVTSSWETTRSLPVSHRQCVPCLRCWYLSFCSLCSSAVRCYHCPAVLLCRWLKPGKLCQDFCSPRGIIHCTGKNLLCKTFSNLYAPAPWGPAAVKWHQVKSPTPQYLQLFWSSKGKAIPGWGKKLIQTHVLRQRCKLLYKSWALIIEPGLLAGATGKTGPWLTLNLMAFGHPIPLAYLKTRIPLSPDIYVVRWNPSSHCRQ